MATTKTGPRYFAMMLMPTVCAGPQILLYKTLNIHMARPYPKRAAGVAMINAIGGISNVWTSYLYYSSPHYYAAFGCCESFSQRDELISKADSMEHTDMLVDSTRLRGCILYRHHGLQNPRSESEQAFVRHS
jgi:hypothetical protein